MSEYENDIEIARSLAEAGVPIFLAEPVLDSNGNWIPDGGTGGCGYWLPRGWEQTAADPAVLDRWRPGMAVCAVGGHGLDFLDCDPRSDGDKSRQDLISAGLWPMVLGVAETPSGGTHEPINGIGTGSLDGFRSGLDLKGGKPDGTGRGFVFIAPTRKLSKTTGEIAAYRWVTPPMLDELDPADDTGAAIADMIGETRSVEPAEDVPHDTYDDMGGELQARVTAWLAAAVKRETDHFADIAAWPEGKRESGPNGKPRGWERIVADLCWTFGRYARADWTPWTYDDAWTQVQAIVPARVDKAVGLADKWRVQRGRGRAATFPKSLTEADSVAAYVAELDDGGTQNVGTPEPRTLDEVRATFRRWLGEDYDTDALDVMLAAAAVERLDGDPLWLLLVSGSGNAKTETVQALSGIGAHVVSTISSEGALLSATSKRERTKDATGGLLREVGDHGVVVIKDVTSILSMNRDMRAQVLGALREIHDGGWTRKAGTDGGRSLSWEGRVVVIGAVTTAWDQAHAVIASMGDRFVLLRMDSTKGRQAAGRRSIRNTGEEDAMRAELAAAVAGVLAGMDKTAVTVTDDEIEVLLAAADLVTLARTGVEFDYRGDVIDAHAPEMPTRFAKELTQVVRGAAAVGMDRTEALKLAIRCARDSMPPLRLAIIDDLSKHPDSSTADVRKRLEKPRNTVDRQLQGLHMLGVVECDEIPYGNDKVRWFYRLAAGIDPDALSVKKCSRNVSTRPYPLEKSGQEDGYERSLGTDKSGTHCPTAACRTCGGRLSGPLSIAEGICATCDAEVAS